ncbi:MAG: DUF2807 domain-containing protein [Saprospiraceae bacterium]|nr:DUF2807 domain-containing protein [Saprospiraceae bacterium]
MKTSSKLLIGLLAVMMTMILSFLITARMNAEVASPEERASRDHGDVQGNGRLGVDLRSITDYTSIALHARMDVEMNSTLEQVEVEAEDNIFGNIITKVEDGTLHIHWKKGEWVNATQPVKIRVPLGEVNTLVINDSGFITVTDTIMGDTLRLRGYGSGDMSLSAQVNYLDAEIHGNGNMEVAGTTNHLDLGIYGSGDLTAFELAAQTAGVHSEGNGGAKIRVAEVLKGVTHGRGHIRLKGTANTDEFKPQNGRLILLKEE